MNQQLLRCRRGFTLIEVLIVMTILIILTGLVAVGARVAINSSKTSATKVLVSQLEAALNQKIERFLRDTQTGAPIETYRYWAGADNGDFVDANNAFGQRATIIARMDAMRSAFPQSFAEMVPSVEHLLSLRIDADGTSSTSETPANSLATSKGHLAEILTEEAGVTAGKLRSPVTGTASAPVAYPYPTHQSLLIEYLLATQQIASKAEFGQLGGYNVVGDGSVWASQSRRPTAVPHLDWTTTGTTDVPRTYTLPNGLQAGPHNPATESSECLYLILSDRTQGESGIEAISAQFIRDTDNDGLLEFVDAWGKPIRFYRWATDTYAYWMEVTKQYPGTVTSRQDLDGNVNTVDGLGNNTFDPNGYLYDYQPVSGSAVWWPAGNTAVSTSAPVMKDIFEAYFGRLSRAYNYDGAGAPYSAPIQNVTIAADPVTGRNNSTGTLNGNEPRVYPFRPLIVSAGPDGEFGMYDLNSDWSGQGNAGNSGTIYPQLHLGYRCGRVEEDPARRVYFQDNIVAVELQEGVKQ